MVVFRDELAIPRNNDRFLVDLELFEKLAGLALEIQVELLVLAVDEDVHEEGFFAQNINPPVFIL